MHFTEIIDTIKKRRDMLNITQESLAELSGVGLRTIKEVERGKGNPTIQTLHKITEVLGMELCLKIKNVSSS